MHPTQSLCHPDEVKGEQKTKVQNKLKNHLGIKQFFPQEVLTFLTLNKILLCDPPMKNLKQSFDMVLLI